MGDLRARRLWLVTGWSLVIVVIYLSLTPTPVNVELEQGDKFFHALAYLALMSWFTNLYENLHERVVIAMGFMLLGIGLEVVQGFVGYRSFEVADMSANAAGVALGWFLATPRTPNYLALAERAWRVHS